MTKDSLCCISFGNWGIQSENYVLAKSGFLLDAKNNKFEMNSNAKGSRFTFDGTGLRLYDEKGQVRIEIALE